MKKNFLKGIARSVDMYATFSSHTIQSDSEAMKSDWQTIGKDIKQAFRTWQKKS